jgi:hypothetical protein
MTVPEVLLALAEVDTEADQLAHRREHTPRRGAAIAAVTARRTWERRRDEIDERIEALGALIEESEAKSAALRTQRQRLEAQLRTVIAPREAEALQHEIATLAEHDEELDTVELEALEEQAQLDDERVGHGATESAVDDALALARGDLDAEVAEIDERVAALGARRSQLRTEVPEAYLATYDRKRAALGVAVARLVGRQCQGCHLELSAAEIDTVKADAAETGVTDCPECGRLLIV